MRTVKSDLVSAFSITGFSFIALILLVYGGGFGQALVAFSVVSVAPALVGIARALLLRRRLLRSLRKMHE